MMVASAILPIEASHAAWLSDLFKGGAEPAKSHARVTSRKPASRTKHAAAPKRHNIKLASLGPTDLGRSNLARSTLGHSTLGHSALAPVASTCDPAKFRIVVDVGHTAESEGAISSRNVPEFAFNLRLARRIEGQLKLAGFAATKLMVTEGRARPSLFRRVAAANNLRANLFLSIHHDAVPNKFLEDWEFEGKKSHFSDRFSGYSVYVSRDNPEFRTSLSFAQLVGKQMKAQGLQYATQYTQAIMGRYQHPLLNKDTGVYSYDELIVLRKTQMAAVLLEAGSIINRDEELKMNSPENQDKVASAVVEAAKEFCPAFLGPP
jgi:N-acetylmuramoyl-L-alanine amidase